MRQGNLQISPRHIAENRVVRTVNTRSLHHDDEDDSLIIAVLQRRWKLLTLCTLLSAIIAAGAYAHPRCKLPKSITMGQLMYKSLPPSRGSSADMKLQPLTIPELVRSNECISTLREKCGLTISAKRLQELITVDANRYSDIIGIEFEWNNGQEGIDIVNTLMSIVKDQVIRDRQQTLEQWGDHQDIAIREIEVKIENERQNINSLQESLNSVLTENGALNNDQSILVSRINNLEKSLQDKILERNTLSSQLTSLRTDARGIDERLRQEAVDDKLNKLETRKGIVRTTTPRMRELEQKLSTFLAENRDLPYPIFLAKLEALDNGLLERGTAPNPTLALLEGDLRMKLSKIEQLELQEMTLPDQIHLLHSEKDKASRELAKLTGSEQFNTVHLEEAHLRLEELRQVKSGLVNDGDHYRRLKDTKYEELTVHTEAGWPTTEEYDGKKKVFALVFATGMIVFALPIFALEHFFPSGDASEHLSKSLGVPVVGKGTFVSEYLRHDKIRRHPVNTESLRLLALRIQQSVQGPGAMVLFSGLNHDQTSIPTITFLAECLSRREERVLIVDACDNSPKRKAKASDSMNLATPKLKVNQITNDSGAREISKEKDKSNGSLISAQDQQLPLGLSDFFARTEVDAKDVICSTEIPGVDIIPSGNGSFPGEAFGSRRINQLFDDCRQEYTLILVSGPSTSQPSDLQMLSARAEGILFTAPKNAKKKGRGEEIVSELMDLGAPVIGIVG